MEEPSVVGLAEVIDQIRDELEQARTSAEGKDIGFTVDRVSLEFTVQVHRTSRAGGGLRIGVVTAELGGSVDSSTTHRVQVELEPHTRAGGRVQVTR
ncbi:MAG: hypothetical protein HOY69_39000 [Streptomyces sp.]|nr:hypothetical protein [Streptomyces sp.]